MTWLGLACAGAREEATLFVADRVVPGAPGASVLLVRAGRIVAVGDSALARDPRAEGARLVAWPGATITPPLVDHHIHLFNVGLTLLNDREQERLFLDLSRARSVAEVGALVRARAARLPQGSWIIGTGWNQVAWGMDSLPDRSTLDAAAPDHPVFLGRSDGHAGWANGRALALAGIDRETPDPAGGRIGRRRDGAPNGVLLERANEPVSARLPAPADSDVVTAWHLAADAMLDRGVTRVYDAGALPLPQVVALNADHGHLLTLLRRADSTRPLPIQVHLMVPAPSALADSVLAAASPRGAFTLSPRLAITHVKLFADGALGSRGGALTHPYADDPTTSGVPRMSTDEIVALAARALDAGLGVATHAIGDDAVRRALDAYERLLATRPGLDPRRLRIEHFSYAREPDLARAVRLGIVLSVQANFNAAPSDAPTFGAVRVGAANEARVYPWRRLHEMGALLAEGSDYFTRPAPALSGFEAMLTRRAAIAEGMADTAARSLALAAATRWFPLERAPEPPALAPGDAATFVVWPEDPMRVDPRLLSGLSPRAIVVEGGVVRRP